jgi:hypothetical protein
LARLQPLCAGGSAADVAHKPSNKLDPACVHALRTRYALRTRTGGPTNADARARTLSDAPCEPTHTQLKADVRWRAREHTSTPSRYVKYSHLRDDASVGVAVQRVRLSLAQSTSSNARTPEHPISTHRAGYRAQYQPRHPSAYHAWAAQRRCDGCDLGAAHRAAAGNFGGNPLETSAGIRWKLRGNLRGLFFRGAERDCADLCFGPLRSPQALLFGRQLLEVLYHLNWLGFRCWPPRGST